MNLFLGEQWRKEVTRLADAVLTGLQVSATRCKRLCVGRHFLLQDQEVHYLVEHSQWACLCRAHALHSRLDQLVSRLLCVDFERLDSLAEHINLAEDAFQVRLERPLEDLEGRLLLQLPLFQTIEGIEAEFEEGAEEAFRRAGLVPRNRLFQVPQDRLFAVVVHDKEVALVQAGVQDARHDRLVVRQELLLVPHGLPLVLQRVAKLLVLLVYDL